MTNIINYNESGKRGPSTDLWKGHGPCHGDYFVNPGKGWAFFDDFFRLPATANGYTLEQADDKAAIATLATVKGGAVAITITGDDNEQATIGYGDAATAPFEIDQNEGAVYFEARIKSSVVTDDVNSFFIGLAEENCAGAADFITDDGADIADKDCVGFLVKADDGNAIDTIFQTAGSAFTTVQAGAGVQVADTWIKLGIHFDGVDTVSFYVDGVKCTTTCLASATGFPDGEEMTPLLSVKVSSDAALVVTMDWWAAAQEEV